MQTVSMRDRAIPAIIARDAMATKRIGEREKKMVVADSAGQLDKAIKQTVKTFKAASAMQVWTWSMNREGDLLMIESRLDALAQAGMLHRIANSFPPAYKMGRWK
ncbi:MAG: hypothetical protein M3008_11265 [Chloroflexota bacterium]|nr:hypothetical protein [Chloroflexota bacterium]